MDLPAADNRLAPAPDAVARFAVSLDALWPGFSGDDVLTLGVAVSGGPDSLAMLLLAAAALPGRVQAATVDHGLRAESVAEAAMVARVCLDLAVPHATLAVSVEPGNVQGNARIARYQALAGWMRERGLAALATAHHADDQAETLLLRLNRASGVAGLAGVRPAGCVPGSDLPLLRPLLEWRRPALAAVVEAAGLCAVDDPSNADDRFDRARLRSALAGVDWLDIPSIADSAAHLADADAALAWAADREWTECVRREGLALVYRPRAPRAVALRVIARIVVDMGDGDARGDFRGDPRGRAVARVLEALVAGQPASIANLVARPVPEGWAFTRAPARRSS